MRSLPSFLLIVAAFVFAQADATHAQANYPNRPIQLVVTVPPGGAADIVARLIGGEAVRRAGSTGHHQQSRRRRRHDRRGAGRQVRPGRLHAAAEHDRNPRHRPAHLRQPAVRSGEGLRAGHPDREIAADHGDQRRASRPHRCRRDRARESEAGRAQLLVRRHRRRAASGRRDVQEPHRHRAAARALSRQRTGGHRSHRRAHHDDVRRHALAAAAHHSRQAPSHRRRKPAAASPAPGRSLVRRGRPSRHGYRALVWRRRARRHACADRATAQCRTRKNRRHARRAQEPDRTGRGHGRRQRGRFRRVHAQRVPRAGAWS